MTLARLVPAEPEEIQDQVHLAGLPAASVPFGSDQGLPLGLQIVAPAGGEQTVLALAAEIERLRP